MSTPPRRLVAVVEDEADSRANLVEFLEMRGFPVQGFESAEAFLKACDELRLVVVGRGPAGRQRSGIGATGAPAAASASYC